MWSEEKWIEFMEWAGYNHVFLNGVWVHKYSNQLDKSNWITTKELIRIYNRGSVSI